MNLPALIDVGLGLAVVFFLLATIGSIIVELVAGQRRWRHQELQRTIANLVGAGYEKKNRRQGPFWQHPIIAPLGTLDKDGPGYLSSDRFATAAIDLALGGDAASSIPPTRAAIRNLIHQHAGNQPRLRDSLLALLRAIPADDPNPLAALRTAAAHWYDEAMQRTTGAYKRKVQRALFITGLSSAVLLNVDAVRITQILYRDPDLRKAAADFAVETAKTHSAPPAANGQGNGATPDLSIAEARQALSGEIKQLRELTRIGFPIGWVTPWHMNFVPIKSEDFDPVFSWVMIALFTKIAGLLATAFAVCLGAPFWFDLINKLVKLRSSGGAGTASATSPSPNLPGDSGGGGAPAGTTLPGGSAPVSASAALAATSRAEPPDFATALADPRVEFSPAKALRLAEVARLAYDKPLEGGDTSVPGTFEKCARGPWGCTGFVSFVFSNTDTEPDPRKQIDTQAYLVLAPGVAVLSFRGTEATAPADWVTDAKFSLAADPAYPGNVHTGFAAALAKVYDDRGGFTGIKSEIAKLAGSGRLLYLTGHSLGAALATLAAFRLEQERVYRVQSVYTYGSPRVGDSTFATAYSRLLGARTYRIVNNEDAVTRVPPPVPPKLDYKHIGEIVFIDDAARLQRDIGFWYRTLNFTANAVGDGLGSAGKRAVSDHDMLLYLGQLTKAARNPTIV